MPILIYGDAHKCFEPLFEAVAEVQPEHVVLLGDLELERPLREALAPILASGIGLWWILGNHDLKTEAMHDFLFASHPDGNLGGRVVRMPCRDGVITVGGLGGIYRQKVWMPVPGAPPARYHTRAEYIRTMGRSNQWRGGLPLRQRDSIFPEDHEHLAQLRCDVLVAHEAPSTHRHGFQVLDDLAHAMHAKLIVHGHHHQGYTAAAGGIRVRGLDGAETMTVRPDEL